MLKKSFFNRFFAAFLTFVFLVQASSAQLLPDLGDPAQDSLTPAQEKRIAEEVMRAVRFHEPSYLDDPEVEEYLASLGKRLLAGWSAQQQDYQFFVLRDSSINAFAMPGGVIGVHTGLIVASQAESELASVLAHEIGHVEQHHMARILSRQGTTVAVLLASIMVAILAGRSNPDVAGAVVAGGQAAVIQNQLSYSRDYEREADRIGLQILNSASFDPQGMPDFFERMYQHTRTVDNNAPAYLRTHPLTQERIADISGRVQKLDKKPQKDSLEFRLLRAKIEVLQLGGHAALRRLSDKEPKGLFEKAAQLYALVRAEMAEHKFSEAREALGLLQSLKLESPMIFMLSSDLARAEGREREAAEICRRAQAIFPDRPSFLYCEAEALLAGNKPQSALKSLDGPSRLNRKDYRLFLLQAKANTALGFDMQAHQALGEAYFLQGDLAAAIDQFQLAQRTGDGSFVEQAALDARLRELRNLAKEDAKAQRFR